MKNERNDLVEHSGRFSIITLRGGVLARIGGPGWKEQDEAVLEHRSKLNSDEEFSNKGIVVCGRDRVPSKLSLQAGMASSEPRSVQNLVKIQT